MVSTILSIRKVFSISWTVERKYRIFAYLSILIPIGGFLLITILEVSSNNPTYDERIPGWQYTVISIYGIIMVSVWIIASVYYSNREATKLATEENNH